MQRYLYCRSPLAATVVAYLNFTPIFHQPTDGAALGIPTKIPDFGGILGDLYHNRTDVAILFTGGDIQVRPPAHLASSMCSFC